MRGDARALAQRYADEAVRGEIVLVVGGASDPPADEVPAAAIDAVRRLVAAGARSRDAAGVVAELTGVAKNALHRAASGT